MARPKVHTDELREELVGHAVATVASDGAGALSLRAVADRSGTSTTAVYSLFGSKEALQREVLIRAYDDFAASQRSIDPTDEPLDDLAGLGMVYLQWALDHPHLYEAMFGEALVGIAPSEATTEAAHRAMVPLTGTVQRCLAAGALRAADEATIVASLWAQVHGLAGLLLTGRLPEGADVAQAAWAAIEGWRAPSA